MQLALSDAGLEPSDIDYINLHGTGTPSNDRSESQAVTAVFGAATPCSSTKGATGHTLGAAGALEAVIGALALRQRFDAGRREHDDSSTRRSPPTTSRQRASAPSRGC